MLSLDVLLDTRLRPGWVGGIIPLLSNTIGLYDPLPPPLAHERGETLSRHESVTLALYLMRKLGTTSTDSLPHTFTSYEPFMSCTILCWVLARRYEDLFQPMFLGTGVFFWDRGGEDMGKGWNGV